MKPETSTNEKPMKDQRINVLLRTGLRLIDKSKNENISPTPTPTPARDIRGILEAKYLKPSSIIKHVKTGRTTRAVEVTEQDSTVTSIWTPLLTT